MIILDHVLMGTALGLCDPNSSPYILAAAIGGSVLPDVDTVHGKPGSIGYLIHHRTYSHSLFGAPLYALMWAFLLKIFGAESSISLLWLWSLVGLLGHILVDILNGFGTMVWWPFDKRMVALDILFEFDLAFTSLFASAIIFEIFGNHFWNIPAWIIASIFAYAIYRYLHSRMLSRERFQKIVAEKSQLLPETIIDISVVPAKYWLWKGIISTPSSHYIIREVKKNILIEERPVIPIPEKMKIKEILAYENYARHLDVQLDGTLIRLRNLIYSPTTYLMEVDFQDEENPSVSISLPSLSRADY